MRRRCAVSDAAGGGSGSGSGVPSRVRPPASSQSLPVQHNELSNTSDSYSGTVLVYFVTRNPVRLAPARGVCERSIAAGSERRTACGRQDFFGNRWFVLYCCLLFPSAALAFVHFKAAEAGCSDVAWLRLALRGLLRRTGGRSLENGVARTTLAMREFKAKGTDPGAAPRHKRTKSDVQACSPLACLPARVRLLRSELWSRPWRRAGVSGRSRRQPASRGPCRGVGRSLRRSQGSHPPASALFMPLSQQALAPSSSGPPRAQGAAASKAASRLEGSVIPLCYALFSAAPGTFTVVFAKIVAVLLRISATTDDNQVANRAARFLWENSSHCGWALARGLCD